MATAASTAVTAADITSLKDAILDLGHALKSGKKDAELTGAGLSAMAYSSKEARISFENLRDIALKVGQVGGKTKEEFTKLAAEYRRSAKESINLNKEADRLMKTYAAGHPIMTKLSAASGVLKNGFVALAGTMALTGLGFRNLVSSTTEYNKVLFEVQRNSQVLGGGIKSLDSAYKGLGVTTSYSQKEFADLTNTFQNAYIGAGKSAENISKMASSLEKAFGPDMNAKKEALSSLLGVMNKFPALYDQIESVMNLAQSGGSVDQVAGMSAQMILIGRAAGMTANEFKTMGQAMMKPTEEQEKQIKLNRQMAEMTARWNNLILKAGQLMEPVLKILMGFLNFIGRITDGMGAWPATITLATMAFAGLKTSALAFDFVIGGVLKKLGQMALAKMGFGAASKAAGGIVPAAAGAGASGAGTAATAAATRGISAASSALLIGKAKLVGGGLGVAGIGYGAEKLGDYLKTSKSGTVQQVGKATSALGGAAKYGGIGMSIGGLAGPVGAAILGTIGAIGGGVYGIYKQWFAVEKEVDKNKKQLEEIEGRYGKIEAASTGVKAEEEEKIRILFKQNAEYLKQQMNLKAVQSITEGITSANKSMLDTMTEMGIIDPELIKKSSLQNLEAAKASMEELVKTSNRLYDKGGATDTMLKDALGTDSNQIKQKMGISIDRDMTKDELDKFNREVARLLKEKESSKEGLNVPIQLAKDGPRLNMGKEEATSAIKREIEETQSKLSNFTIGTKKIKLNAEGDIDGDMAGKLAKYTQDKKDNEKDFSKIDEFEQLITLQEKMLTLKASEASITALNNSYLGQTLTTEQLAAETLKGKKASMDAILIGISEEANKTEQLGQIAIARIKSEADLAQAAGAGAGPSLRYRQQQLEVEGNIVNKHKEAIARADDQISAQETNLGLSQDTLTAYKEALTPQERVSILMEKGGKNADEAKKAEQDLSSVTQARTVHITKQNEHIKNMYELSKDMREGYMQAIGEMAVGAGDFAAIIGNQAKGADQLIDAIDANTTTGTRGLGGSLLVGGRTTDTVRARGYRSEAQASYREDGSLAYRNENASKYNQAEIAYPLSRTGKGTRTPMAGSASVVIGGGGQSSLEAAGVNMLSAAPGMQPVAPNVAAARRVNDAKSQAGQIGVQQTGRNAASAGNGVAPMPPNTGIGPSLIPAPAINSGPVPPPALPSRTNDASSASKMPVTEIVVKLGPGLVTDFQAIKEGIAAISAVSNPNALS